MTRPICCASSASTIRPVRIRSSARPRPTIARQPLRAAVDQRHAPAALGEAEASVPSARCAGRTRARARGRRPGPAGDRGDRRLRDGQPREAHRPVPRASVGPSSVERLQVGAGAEGLVAGAGEHHAARVVVGLEAARRPPASASAVVAVDGVAPLGAVDRDDRGRADPFVVHFAHHDLRGFVMPVQTSAMNTTSTIRSQVCQSDSQIARASM